MEKNQALKAIEENTKGFSKQNLFRNILDKNSGFIHFIAIGGIGMSALAKIMLEKGYKVSGSDIKPNSITESLTAQGATVVIGHSPENINDCSLVVVSSAIKHDNPELIEAQSKNLPIIHRSQLLEYLMSGEAREKTFTSIGVTGTHGKTTTSGMTAYVLQAGGLNPSFAIGGQLPEYNVNSQGTDGKYFVSELDESDGSIELYTPDISIVTNLELDHADHYERGFEQILETFERYINELKPNAKVITNIDDKGNLELLERVSSDKIITYSIESKDADYTGKMLADFPNAELEAYHQGKFLAKIKLGVPGYHNVSNTLAVVAALNEAGVDIAEIASKFEGFTGMKRRFQTVAIVNNARIIDDYAHHPTEIKATLKTARKLANTANGRVVAVFQPHRYSRLANLWKEFANSFTDADKVYLCDVYAAGETPFEGVTSENLCNEIDCTRATYVSGDLELVAKVVKQDIQSGDVVLTIGAGNITQLGSLIEKA